MQTIISKINDTHPGFDIYLKDGKIVVDKFYLGGKRLLGTFETTDELYDFIESQGAPE